jgi:hypothetical protein
MSKYHITLLLLFSCLILEASSCYEKDKFPLVRLWIVNNSTQTLRLYITVPSGEYYDSDNTVPKLKQIASKEIPPQTSYPPEFQDGLDALENTFIIRPQEASDYFVGFHRNEEPSPTKLSFRLIQQFIGDPKDKKLCFNFTKNKTGIFFIKHNHKCIYIRLDIPSFFDTSEFDNKGVINFFDENYERIIF